ncbi:MAG: SagB/ThcOx family dehydrogenase [Planctomycetota bacterium]
MPEKHTTQESPPPLLAGAMSLEEAIARRRSVRELSSTPLPAEQIAQLCWAGQGITDRAGGLRAAPSAGALFPIELYVVTADGVEHYHPAEHCLTRHLDGDLRGALQQASLHQEAVADAPVCVVLAAVPERLAVKYGQRAERYCFVEAGHAAQNILLQAAALNLGGVPVGAFEDQKVARVLHLPATHRVLYLLPIGQAR